MAGNTFALSPLQQGMLFHSVEAAQPGVDIEQVICRARETIDPVSFYDACQQLAARHEILRASFHWREKDEPFQQVHPQVVLPVDHQDWSDACPATQSARLAEYLGLERARGFDLARPCLMRCALIRLGENDSWIVWTFHHLLIDGRSLVLFFEEFFHILEAAQDGRTPELKPAPSYQSFIEWLQARDTTSAEIFWREHLRGFEAPVALNVRRHQLADTQPDFRGEQSAWLPAEATAALKQLAETTGVTLNAVLQGAWALLLSRYSATNDVIFGAVRACRRNTVPDAEATLGLFINTVPIRIQVQPDLAVGEYLKAIREGWVALRPYEQTPLVVAQGCSQVSRELPLFETLFNFQNPSWDAALQARGGKWANREFTLHSQSNYPLAVDVYGGDRLLIKLLYHRHRFDDASIEAMLAHFQTLLEHMGAGAAQKLADISMLPRAERTQLLEAWNQTAAEFPRDRCVPELFEEQAARNPDALALRDAQSELTYGELNCRAEALAAELRQQGVQADVPVGVCTTRSVDMVVALLAVLKAGGAYVPLDPAYPQERLQFMLKDCGASVVLTQSNLLASVQFAGLQAICVDQPVTGTNSGSPANKSQKARPDSLAYIIYTSGSTGVPKGVEIEHASLMNLVQWHQSEYQVTSADRATQLASPAFDASVWELWPYLTAGASIHFPDEETRVSPAKLPAWLASNQITIAFLPTPIAEAVMKESWPQGCTMRALLTGGDKMHQAPPANFPCRVTNHYGPTENTVVTTWTEVRAGSPGIPTIGRPIANTQVYVLAANGEPVPEGVPGELFIGGVGLARGYRQRPKLTAERFVPNPFNQEAGSRLYRTGDMVRRLGNGDLEFLGRTDAQIKIRGNRIEPGEIEALLAGYPDVQASAVFARQDPAGGQRLIACVAGEGASLNAESLRRYLEAKLPEYMVPSGFVFVDALPLSPNGKIDTAALPEAEVSSHRYVAPRSRTERMLAVIWAEVLGVAKAGIHDDFFEMGGHSLLGTRICARVSRDFDVELPLRDVFSARTIAAQAQRIDALRQTRRANQIPPLTAQPADAVGGVLTFAQERMWFLEQLGGGQPFNNMPVVLRIQGSVNETALADSINQIIARHRPLRTVFGESHGQPRASVLSPKPLKIAVIDLTEQTAASREDQLERLIQEEARRPFNLQHGPLCRVSLVKLTKQVQVLLVTMHHLVSDGWSFGIFLRELSALYEAQLEQRTAHLPELAIDYDAYATWQRQWLESEAMEQQLQYWKKQLHGPLPVLNLSTDHPRPAVQTYHGATCRLAFPARISAGLQYYSEEHGVSHFMILLAAFQALLHRCTGDEDILIGTPIAGRGHVETEDLIGLFLNTLVLRTHVNAEATFAELLERTRQTTLDALANQDVPLERLAAEMQNARDLSRPPLFQTMFVLQNGPVPRLTLPGAHVTTSIAHNGTSKFDLTLCLEEGDDGLSGYVEYNTDLFAEATVRRWVEEYQTLLEGALASPATRISELPILPEAERRQVLTEWNRTQTEFPQNLCVPQLIEQQVRRTPDAVALVFGDEQLTYRELDARAETLAVRLREAGVQADVPVAVCLSRSLEMVTCLLGILKAGGCYVPLDPAYPRDRLTYMLEDSRAPILLTESDKENLLPATSARVILMEEALKQGVPATPQANASKPLSPEQLAYIIYTSGSTGRPKGVMVTHRNVVNFFAGMDQVLGTQPGTWLAVTSISFDISVLELFWTLARGFRVVIQPESGKAAHEASTQGGRLVKHYSRSLPDEILRHGITHLQCTPSFARMLLSASKSRETLGSLKYLLLGGEALPVSLAEDIRKVFKGTLCNLYGPTETTVWSSAFVVGETGTPLSIGRPIANTQIYLLDTHRQPVPIGVAGEIYIGGTGVARGYLNQPALTSERFLPDPFQSADGRMYRTGDRARWLADGTIEYLGRDDHQVKVRGHRIELGEVEAALAQCTGVREAAVTVRDHGSVGAELVAYVVPINGDMPPSTELSRLLRQRIPEAMVPSHFVVLEKMPLTPNGKINRKALPAPAPQRPSLETNYESPRAGLEQTLATLWRQLLGVDRVGRNDNFFDLGGHSLLVVQLQAQVRERLGMDLPVVKFFQFPTVSAFAGYLNRGEASTMAVVEERARRQRDAFTRPRPQRQEVTA